MEDRFTIIHTFAAELFSNKKFKKIIQIHSQNQFDLDEKNKSNDFNTKYARKEIKR